MSGWFVVHRGWMDSFKPEPFTEREAFLWSVERAAIKDHDQWFNGLRVPICRGEFATSLRLMADTFSWSIKRVRGFMERMGKCEKWAHRQAQLGAQSPTIITVCNYDKYQTVSDLEGTASDTAKGTRGAQQGHSKGTQQNKGNKGNNSKKERPSVSSPEADDGRTDSPALILVRSEPLDDVARAFDEHERLRREINPSARRATLDADRRRTLSARLSEIGGIEPWREVLAQIRGSPFLRGETARTGRLVATIDWLLSAANLRKVREGNFDERHPATASSHGNTRRGPIDALGLAIAASGLGGS